MVSAPDRIGLIQDDFLDGMWALASADEADVSVHYLRATPAREAAHDLLEALEWVLNNRSQCNIPSPDGAWDEMAQAAIAKAKGGVE